MGHILVAIGLVVVDDKVNGTSIEDGVESLEAGLGDRARDFRGDGSLNEGRHREYGLEVKF